MRRKLCGMMIFVVLFLLWFFFVTGTKEFGRFTVLGPGELLAQEKFCITVVSLCFED